VPQYTQIAHREQLHSVAGTADGGSRKALSGVSRERPGVTYRGGLKALRRGAWPCPPGGHGSSGSMVACRMRGCPAVRTGRERWEGEATGVQQGERRIRY
jgi:hypothetical protein